jgi:hypothetical protein
VIGLVPVHVPGEAVSCCPSRAVPAIVGGAVLRGAVAGAARTVSEALVVSEAAPNEFVAVTVARIRLPTSAAASVYVRLVAPATTVHAPPAVLQRCHWYANVIGWVPVHVPLVAVRVRPSISSPVICGRAVLRGAFCGASRTSAVAADRAWALPSAFRALTTTRIRRLTSACTSVYVWLVAPGISEQFSPVDRHRCHW